MKRAKVALLFMLFLFCLGNLVFAQELIRGGRAKDYVGEFSKKFSAGTYTVEVLRRNLRSPATQSKIDGVVFNAQSGSFSYLRRKDANHILILLSYKKTKADKINTDNLPDFEKIIKENKLVPFVLLGGDGAELAIIYAPHASIITAKQRKNKNVYLEIETPDFKRGTLIRDKGNILK